MLARSSLARASVAAPAALGRAPTGARNMATLREIELRLKSVRNIEKITKVCSAIRNVVHVVDNIQSMKMIASTKLAKAQRAMTSGKEYGVANTGAHALSPRQLYTNAHLMQRCSTTPSLTSLRRTRFSS